MAKRDLTDAFIRGAKADRRVEYYDTREAGIMLRVFPSGTKTFAFRLRARDGQIQGAVIGHYPDIRLSEARERAEELRRQVRDGKNITAKIQKAVLAAEAEFNRGIPTLGELVDEYAAVVAPKRKTWQPTKTGCPSEGQKRIRTVYAPLLSTRVNDLSLAGLSHAMTTYEPKSGKPSANGQVSRARAYLMTTLDWGAWRNQFGRVGLGRPVRIDAPDLRQTHDPATDDHSIKGRRDRALNHEELSKILPLLKWPAPKCLKMGASPEKDLRPIAIRFLLLTGARRAELVSMKWVDFRENSMIWHKPYVKTIRGAARQQNLPLSNAAAELLRSLPNYPTRRPDELVFPNLAGGRLGNWNRITSAVQRESQTSDWHRHDLRRTGATIMKLLKVQPRVIDEILAHNASKDDEGTSRALENYLSSRKLLDHIEDPQKSALDALAEALHHIEVH